MKTIVIAGAIALLPILYAQTGASVWDGVYSAAQAERGQALYAKQCSSCHADDLLGSGQAPELTGAEFKKQWDGQTLADLFDRLSTSMPADMPGSLKPDENAAITAFLLKSSGYPAGAAELKGQASALKLIRFDAVRKK